MVVQQFSARGSQKRCQWRLSGWARRAVIASAPFASLHARPFQAVGDQLLGGRLDRADADLPVVLAGDRGVPPAGRESVPPMGGELLLFNSFAGRSGAVRFPYRERASRTGSTSPNLEENWQPFKLIRRATGDAPLRLWIELHGHGAAHLDDIRVHTLSPNRE